MNLHVQPPKKRYSRHSDFYMASLRRADQLAQPCNTKSTSSYEGRKSVRTGFRVSFDAALPHHQLSARVKLGGFVPAYIVMSLVLAQ